MKLNLALAVLVGMAIGMVAVLVLQYERLSPEQKKIEKMQRVCELSREVIDGALEEECGKQIDEVESMGYKVQKYWGNFEVERIK